MEHFSEEVINWWVRWTEVYHGKKINHKEAIEELESLKNIVKGLRNYNR